MVPRCPSVPSGADREEPRLRSVPDDRLGVSSGRAAHACGGRRPPGGAPAAALPVGRAVVGGFLVAATVVGVVAVASGPATTPADAYAVVTDDVDAGEPLGPTTSTSCPSTSRDAQRAVSFTDLDRARRRHRPGAAGGRAAGAVERRGQARRAVPAWPRCRCPSTRLGPQRRPAHGATGSTSSSPRRTAARRRTPTVTADALVVDVVERGGGLGGADGARRGAGRPARGPRGGGRGRRGRQRSRWPGPPASPPPTAPSLTGERYVLLGLARPRAAWFRGRRPLGHVGALPAEFLKCVSAEELRVRLAGGPRPARPCCSTAGCRRSTGTCSPPSWSGRGGRGASTTAGAAATGRRSAPRPSWRPTSPPGPPRGARGRRRHGRRGSGRSPGATGRALPTSRRAASALVCGPGGTGASTVAAALAQGLRPPTARDVVLADLALHAEQAMLHDVRDVVPGVQELVEAHRSGRRRPTRCGPSPSPWSSAATPCCSGCAGPAPGRRCDRGPSPLPSTRSRRVFDVVVGDVTADFEGEADGGSADVEDRNALARTAVAAADVGFVVGRPGVKGLHALVRTVVDVVRGRLRAEPGGAGRGRRAASPRARAEVARGAGRPHRPRAVGAADAGAGVPPSAAGGGGVARRRCRSPRRCPPAWPVPSPPWSPGRAGWWSAPTAVAVRVVPGSLASWARPRLTIPLAAVGGAHAGDDASHHEAGAVDPRRPAHRRTGAPRRLSSRSSAPA